MSYDLQEVKIQIQMMVSYPVILKIAWLQITTQVFVVLSKHYGFVVDRTSESHFQLNHPDWRRLTVPRSKSSDIAVYTPDPPNPASITIIYLLHKTASIIKYMSSAKSKSTAILECVRLASMCQTEEDLLRMMSGLPEAMTFTKYYKRPAAR